MAGKSVGKIQLDLGINKSGFNKEANGLGNSIKSSLIPIAKTIGAAFAVGKLISFGKESIKLGSDLAEVQNVVNSVFTSMSSKVDEFAKSAIDGFGLSETVAKRYMGITGAMSKSFGFTEKNAYSMSAAVTKLAGDVSSFYNISSDEAFTKLKSIWTGETESIKELGVVMTQAALDQYALSHGFGKTTKDMTEQEKVALRYNFVLNKLSTASGDFMRTSNGWANQTRVLKLRFDQLKATIGQGLINALLPVIKLINILVANLQVAANAFSKFTASIFGKADTSAKATTASVQGIGDASTAAVSGIEDTSKAAEKAAKKAKKSISSIDQVNILSKNDDSSSDSDTGAGAGAGGIGSTDVGIDDGSVKKTEGASSKIITALDKIKKKFVELSGIFKKGFTSSIGEINFDNILEHVSGIKESLIGIFTDKEVLSSANGWVNSVTLSLGKITGSFASIGLTAAEFFTGSVDKYLSQNSGFIKESIVSLFDISAKSEEVYANYSTALSDIFTVFRGENAKQIGADLIAIFVNSFLSLKIMAAQFGLDILKAITQPIIDNKDSIKLALENSLSVISTLVGGIKDFINGAFESIKLSYDTYISPALEKFSSGFSIVFSSILDAYNKYFAPTFQSISEKISELLNGPIAVLFQKFTELVGKLVDGIATIWEKTIAPFLAWLMDTFAPKVSGAISNIAGFFIGLVGTIAKVVGDILDALGGIIDFLVGVFTGDWKKAWKGIKTFFSGIIAGIKDIISPIGAYFKGKFQEAWKGVKSAFSNVKTFFSGVKDKITSQFSKIGTAVGDTVGGAFKSIINGVLSLIEKKINGAIDLLNSARKLINKIPGVNIGEIKQLELPRLAQGGFVKANTPQLAMIGDNKHQGEVVAPEDKLEAMALKAAKLAGGNNNSEVIRLLKELISLIKSMNGDTIVNVDSVELARGVKKGQARLNRRYSTTKIITT